METQRTPLPVEKDLTPSWLELSERVRTLSNDLKIKAATSHFSAEAQHLASQTELLCDHVQKLHKEVLQLIETIDPNSPIILHEPDFSAQHTSQPIDSKSIQQESIQIQRENHELRNDLKDILKALFLWVDDPVERLRNKQ